MKVRKNLANIITSSRILATLIMMFMDALSLPFFLCYSWCGISDILDGFVARHLKITSDLGSRLDSFSDLLLYTTMMVMILPYLRLYLPESVWIAIYTILTIRAIHYIYVAFSHHKMNSRHTILNKITSILMFILPFVVLSEYLVPYSWLVLLIAYVAAGEEIIYSFRNDKGDLHAIQR